MPVSKKKFVIIVLVTSALYLGMAFSLFYDAFPVSMTVLGVFGAWAFFLALQVRIKPTVTVVQAHDITILEFGRDVVASERVSPLEISTKVCG